MVFDIMDDRDNQPNLKYEIESIANGYLLTLYREKDSLLGKLMMQTETQFHKDFDEVIGAIYRDRAEKTKEALEET